MKKIKNGLMIAVAVSFLSLAGCASDQPMFSWMHCCCCQQPTCPPPCKDQAIEDYHNAHMKRCNAD